jgi:hypothetical protein
MQLPSVDRQPGVRPSADLVATVAAKVVPVAPVNPPATSEVQAPQPSVVNRIGEAQQPSNVVYTSVSDPAQRGSEANTGSKDWTIQRPEPEQVEDPPPEPISKMLLDFLKSMWRASGGAVEAAQAQAQQAPAVVSGQVASENITYSPSKIKKNEEV